MTRIVVLLILVFTPLLATAATVTTTADETLATVNGVAILSSQVDTEIQRHPVPSVGQPAGADNADSQRRKVLDKLIERELLFQAAQKAGITATPAQIEAQYTKLASHFVDQGGVTAALRSRHTTPKAVKAEIRRALMIHRFLEQQMTADTVVAPAQVRAYYDGHPAEFTTPEQIHAAHIRLNHSLDMGIQEDNRRLLKSIRRQILEGRPFDQLARRYSQDETAASGGDLGWIRRGQMPAAFDAVAFALEPNTVSDVVQTPDGLHLIMVWERKPGSLLPYDAVRAGLTRRLQQESAAAFVDGLLDGLKQEARIVYSDAPK